MHTGAAREIHAVTEDQKTASTARPGLRGARTLDSDHVKVFGSRPLTDIAEHRAFILARRAGTNELA
jgi:hypothetical protein